MKLLIARFAFLPAVFGFSLSAFLTSSAGAAGTVAAGDGSAAAIAAGQLATWGRNDVGQLGHSAGETPVVLPRSVGILPSWTKVSAGARFMVALGEDGKLYAWGDNSAGQLGDGSLSVSRAAPGPVALPDGAVVRDFAAGQSHVVALLDLPGQPGAIFVWGQNTFGQLGQGAGDQANRSTPVRVNIAVSGVSQQIVQIAATDSSSFAISSSGHLWAWGSNARGELGQGRRVTAANAYSAAPLRIGTAKTWTMVVGGARHVLALQAPTRLYAWGDNVFGQCGRAASSAPVLAPAAVTLPRPKGKPAPSVTALAGGDFHSLALTSTGSVYAWGLNARGELGRVPTATGKNVITTPFVIDQDDPASSDPRRRIALPAASSIAAGSDFSLLALTGGGYLAFGANSSGQLGIGSVDTSTGGIGRAPLVTTPNLAVAAPIPVSDSVVSGVPQFGVGSTFGPLALVVRNTGAVAHTNAFRLSFYLSSDNKLDSSDRLLASRTDSVALPAGQLRATAFTAAELTVPEVIPGAYFLLSQVSSLDASGNPIADAYTPDNGASVAVGIVGPDLSISGIIGIDRTIVEESDGGFGNVSTNLININRGLVSGGRGILAELYLSADETLQPDGDTLLKTVRVFPPSGGLVGGAVLPLDFGSVTVPSGANGGDYSLLVVINRDGAIVESGDGANIGRISVRIAAHDLAVTAPALPSTTLGSATTLQNVPVTLQNLGSLAYPGDATVELYLSEKSTFDFTATRIGQQTVAGGLPGQSSRVVVFPSVPLPVSLGGPITFFARVVADPALGDRFPANNLAGVTAAIGAPSFTLSDILLPNTASVEAGGSLGAVSYRFNNAGPGALPAGFPVNVEVYLSADATLDRSRDVLLDRYAYLDGVAPGGSVLLPGAEARPIDIPSGTANGFYSLIIAINADGAQSIFPSAIQATSINVGALNLAVQAPAVPSPALGVNAVIDTVTSTIENLGGFSVPAGLVAELYLSTDTVYDTGDLPLATTTLPTPIAATSTRSVTFSGVSVPDVASGNYHLLVRIVLPPGVLDTDASDNVAATAVSISRPDVAIEDITAPAELLLDAPAPAIENVRFTLKNTSPGVLLPGVSLAYEIYLSRDAVFDARDTLLTAGEVTAGLTAMAQPGSSEIVGPLNLPVSSGLVGGTYHLLVVVNRDGSAPLASTQPAVAGLQIIFQKENAPGRALDYGVVAFLPSGSWSSVSDVRATDRAAYQSSPLSPGQTATMELQVTGPTTLPVPWKLSPGAGDGILLQRDGAPLSLLDTFDPVYRLSGPGGTAIDVPAGEHTVSFTYAQASSDTTAFARVDLDVPSFITGGDADWFGVASTEAKVNGNYARSPQLNAGEQASLEVQVQGPAQVSFWWRARGTATDILEFSIDGELAEFPTNGYDEAPRPARIGNQPEWRRATFLVGGGARTLRWTYTQASDDTSAQGNVDGLVVLNPVPDVSAPNRDTDPLEYAEVPASTVDLGILSAVAPVGTYLLDDAQNGTGRLPVQVAFSNLGKAFASEPSWNASNLELRLSADRLWGNSDDIALGNYAHFQVLQIGEQVTFNAEVNLPLDLPEGTYFLLVRVRAFDEGGEFTLANNSLVLGQSGAGNAYVIRRAPDLRITNFAGLAPKYPYHPEDAVYVSYDIANLGLGDVNPADRFDVQTDLYAIPKGVTILSEAKLLRSFPLREFSVFIPTVRAAYPAPVVVPVVEFFDLPPIRDILVILDPNRIPPGTPEDAIAVTSNIELLRAYDFFFRVTVDAGNRVQESSETNVFWMKAENEMFNMVPAPTFENAGSFYGDVAFGSFFADNIGVFVDTPFDLAAIPPAAGTFTDFIWDYALYRAAVGLPNLLFQQDVQNGISNLNVPPYGVAQFNTLAFDFNVRSTDVEILVQATDDSQGGVWETLQTLTPPYNAIFGSRSLTGYGGLSSSPLVLSVEGNVTNVQRSYAARVTFRDRLPISVRGAANNPRMRLIVRPAAGLTTPPPVTNLSAANVDFSVVLNWTGTLPSNSFGIQGRWIIERSRDGVNFENLGTTERNTFTDSSPGFSGVNTYRVHGVNAAGASAQQEVQIGL